MNDVIGRGRFDRRAQREADHRVDRRRRPARNSGMQEHNDGGIEPPDRQ